MVGPWYGNAAGGRRDKVKIEEERSKGGWAVGPWYRNAAGGKRVRIRTYILGYEEYRLENPVNALTAEGV